MTYSTMNKQTVANPRRCARTGFTLVELLIVIAIMSVIAALVIPKIRVVNKDRNIREAARVVGAMFNSASNRARIDGTAGVMLVKNQNFEQGGRVYAATAMYRLKEVPSYSGTSDNENFQFFYDMTENAWFAEIIRPLQQGLVRAGDTMTVGNEGGQGFEAARILSVTELPVNSPNRLSLELLIVDASGNPLMPGPGAPAETEDLTGNPPVTDPTMFEDDRSWTINRRPRIVESSRVDLAAGYMVDMRYSDYAPDPNQSISRFQQDNDSMVVIFDENGGIDYVDDEFGHSWSQPFSPLYLFVAEELTDGSDPLTKDNNLWVTVNHNFGSVNVGYNLAQPAGQYAQRLLAARQISSSTALD